MKWPICSSDHSHSSRFDGVLIGLACRHLQYDANELMQLADAGGVNYDMRSIGSVPVRGLQWRTERALAIEGPMSPADLAAWISIGAGYEPVSWK